MNIVFIGRTGSSESRRVNARRPLEMVDLDPRIFRQGQAFPIAAVMQALPTGVLQECLSFLGKYMIQSKVFEGCYAIRQVLQTGFDFLDFALVRGCEKKVFLSQS